MQWHRLSVVALLWLVCATAQAVNIKGKEIPETVSIGTPPAQLVLNGAGVRTKFFFSIYIGALYVPKQHTDLRILESLPGYKRIVMNFIYDEVEAKKLADSWEEGFVKNQSPDVMQRLRPKLDEFKKLFPTVKNGDVIWIDYIPDIGTQVSLNTKRLGGAIQGADFYRAVMHVWLGKEPADSNLKQAMLGITDDDEE